MSTISQAKSKNAKKKKFRPDAKFWTRILVIILTLAMLAGTFYYILIFSVGSSRVNAASEITTDDLRFRVALIYGDSMQTDFRSRADNGFTLGFNTGNEFTAVTATPVTLVRFSIDANLTADASGRYQTSSEGAVNVGAYHVKIAYSGDDFDDRLAYVAQAFPEYNVFPGYYDGKTYIMAGQFSDAASADNALSAVKEKLAPEKETEPPDTEAPATEGEDTAVGGSEEPEVPKEPEEPEDALVTSVREAVVSQPSGTAVTVIDPAAHRLLWIFDDTSGKTFFGAKATQKAGTFTYIIGWVGAYMYYYDDTIECSVRKTSAGKSGMNVVNVLPLETYISGVIPYEIGKTWPLETQKAFAIAVRSYAISGFNRHKGSANADLCNTAHCQVYKGFVSATAQVKQAASETKGLIAVYRGRMCSTFYSSSTGGCTANVSQVWGGNQTTYGYLKAVATPWEKYNQYGNGRWTSTATGAQLRERLIAKGYTALTGPVTKLEIVSLQNNSSYVYSVKFSDAAGHSVTVKRTDKVKSVLSPYVKSGNFVVAKGGENVTRINYVKPGFGAVNSETTEGVSVRTNPETGLVYGRQNFSVITAGGIKSFVDSNSEKVMTSGGIRDFTMSKFLDSNYYPTVTGKNGEVLPDILNTGFSTVTETITAGGKSDQFVFIGRGWGHGVGLSQYGIKDLGDLGYDFETIFKAYYSDAEIISYTEYRNSRKS